MDAVFYIALTLTVFLIVALLAAPVMLRPSKPPGGSWKWCRAIARTKGTSAARSGCANDPVPGQAASWIRFGLAEDEEVKQLLLSAGVRSTRGMNAYFASRILGPISGLICGSLIHSQHALLGFVPGRRLLSDPGYVAENQDQATERKNQERPSRRARSAGHLRGGRIGSGSGNAAGWTGAGYQSPGYSPGVHASQPGAACRQASPGSMEKHSGAYTNCGVLAVCQYVDAG